MFPTCFLVSEVYYNASLEQHYYVCHSIELISFVKRIYLYLKHQTFRGLCVVLVVCVCGVCVYVCVVFVCMCVRACVNYYHR